MKKIFALILTLTMVFSLAALPAFADESKLDNTTPAAYKDVKATYNAGDSAKTVYSVNITWGAMDFKYNDGAWNPETHKYDANWSATGNTVTVTNHSNADVDAKLTYTAAEGYEEITPTFNKDTLNLKSAVGTDVNNAPTDSAELELSGVLNNAAKDATVGTITVTLLS